MRTLCAFATLAALASSCTDQVADPTPAGPEELQLLIFTVSGDTQEAVAGVALPAPLVVQVRDVWGNGVAGVRVIWSVTSGLGTFSTSNPTTTGANGQTSISFTPGTASAEVRAEVEGRAGINSLFQVRPRQVAVYDRLVPPGYCGFGVCESIVFYADNTFGVRYPKEFPGTFNRNGTVIELVFKEERWRATATVRGDSLLVKYNIDASMADFEDGTFLLKQGVPPEQ